MIRMPRFAIEIKKSAEKELARLPKRERARFVQPINALADDPLRPRSGVDIKRLKGTRALYRLRVGDYRGIYEIEGARVIFTRFGHRSKIYDV